MNDPFKKFSTYIDHETVTTTDTIYPPIMTTKQTPLQKLIEEMKFIKQFTFHSECKRGISDAIGKAESLLPEEKQMVIDSYDKGVFNAKLQQTVLYQNGEQYFKETYK